MTFDPLDYWQLRARDGDVQREQLALALAQQRLQQAQQARRQLWDSLAAKYKLDPDRNYIASDADCSLQEPQ